MGGCGGVHSHVEAQSSNNLSQPFLASYGLRNPAKTLAEQAYPSISVPPTTAAPLSPLAFLLAQQLAAMLTARHSAPQPPSVFQRGPISCLHVPLSACYDCA